MAGCDQGIFTSRRALAQQAACGRLTLPWSGRWWQRTAAAGAEEDAAAGNRTEDRAQEAGPPRTPRDRRGTGAVLLGLQFNALSKFWAAASAPASAKDSLIPSPEIRTTPGKPVILLIRGTFAAPTETVVIKCLDRAAQALAGSQWRISGPGFRPGAVC